MQTTSQSQYPHAFVILSEFFRLRSKSQSESKDLALHESVLVKLKCTFICCLIFFATAAFSQQVASRDLTTFTRAPASVPQNPAAAAQEKNCPSGIIATIADGVIIPEKKENLKLTLVGVIPSPIQVAGDITATIRLENKGNSVVQVPWTKDEERIRDLPQEEKDKGYEFASISLELRTGSNRNLTSVLKAEAQLFAHPDEPWSHLEIAPGHWVEIKFKGSVQCKRKDFCNLLQKDDAGLLIASWDQWLFTTTYKDCEKTDGNYKERELKSNPQRVKVIKLAATTSN